MNWLEILSKALQMEGVVKPLIEGLIAQIKSENPALTEAEITAQAEALAAETKALTEQDMKPE